MTALERVRQAVASNERARIVELVPEMTQQFEDELPRFRALNDRRIVVRRGTADGSNPSEKAEAYGNALQNLRSSRIEVNQALVDYIEGEVASTEALEAIDNALTAAETLETVADQFLEATRPLQLPGILSVSSTTSERAPKGTTFEIGVEVRNAGESELVGLNVETLGDLDLSVAPTAFDLSGGESLDIALEADASDAGEFSVIVEVSNEDNSGSTDFSLIVLSKGDYLDRAIEQTHQLIRRTPENQADGEERPGRRGGSRRNNNGGRNGLQNKLETIENRLRHIQGQLAGTGGPPTSAINDQIESVNNQYGAFTNQVDALRDRQLTPFQATLLGEDAQRAIATLVRAQEAEI